MSEQYRVPPGLPAERLAGDPELADRTRARTARSRTAVTETGALEAFLADEEKIHALKREARREAETRAMDWDLEEHLED